MVFALASHFAYLQSPAQEREQLLHVTNSLGSKFYNVAKTMICDIVDDCSLISAQICLLISLYIAPSNASDASYLYMNMALKKAIACGLHRKAASAGLDPRMVEVRNRTWWTIYTLER